MLDIDIRPQQGVLFVRLAGKLNKDSLEKLKTEVSNFIKRAEIKNIVFNICDLEELDLDGTNELIKNYNYCISNQGKALFVGDKNSGFLKDKIVDDEEKISEFIKI